MSSYDSADLLARCKFLAARPATDSSMSDAQWYMLLTEAQASWTNTIASQAPWVMMGPPTLLVSTDNGATYPFPGCIFPLAVELYDSLGTARPLKNSTFYDASGDYVLEGDHIRFPQGQLVTYANGPYARWINPPDTLDGSNPPTLQPAHARLLLVYRAVAEWASRGGFRDPAPFYAMESRYWYGNPQTGDVGVLAMLKTQAPYYGAAAYQESVGGILDGVDTGVGYRAVRLGMG